MSPSVQLVRLREDLAVASSLTAALLPDGSVSLREVPSRPPGHALRLSASELGRLARAAGYVPAEGETRPR